MLTGLAVSQVLVARTVNDFDPRVAYGLAGLLVVVAGFGLRDVLAARLALRRLGAPASS